MTPPLVHFYHIYASSNMWTFIYLEHLEALRESGLLDALDGNFYVGIIGTDEEYADAVSFLKEHGNPTIVAHETEGWEQTTLDALSRYSKSVEEAFVLYAHTKGGFHHFLGNNNWRKSMTHFVVNKWKVAVEALNSGCHMAGPFWMSNGHEVFFGGNFWWAKASALKLLKPCLRRNRYYAETWTYPLVFLIEDFAVMNVSYPYNISLDRVITDEATPRIWMKSANYFEYNWVHHQKHLYVTNVDGGIEYEWLEQG